MIEINTMNAPPNLYLSNKGAGYAAVALAILLVCALIWVLVYVVQPLTRTTPVTDRVVDALLPRLEKDGNAEETMRLLMALENSAAGIRIATLQVAVATLGGFFLVVIGVVLFAMGANGMLNADLHGGSFTLKFTDLAPGIAAALLGGALIGLGAYRDIKPPAISYKNTTDATSQPVVASDARISDIELPKQSPYRQEEASDSKKRDAPQYSP